MKRVEEKQNPKRLALTPCLPKYKGVTVEVVTICVVGGVYLKSFIKNDVLIVPDEIPGVGFKREQGVLGVGAVNKHDRAENHQGFRMS